MFATEPHHLLTVEGLVTNHILHSDRGVGGLKLAQLTASKVHDFRLGDAAGTVFAKVSDK